VSLMTINFNVQRVLRKQLCLAVAVVMLSALSTSFADAQGSALIVRNDRGGVVGDRVDEIDRLKASGQRVEIRGTICLSSCTMYLGAGDVCVNPDTRFGFHGPSYYGKPLAPDYFQYWSEVISDYYPKPVRDWFMQKARHRLNGYYTVKGAELIRLGVRSC